MDRLGPSLVLRICGPTAAVILGLVALGARAWSTGLILSAACAAGLATAPVGASMRALWGSLTEDVELGQRAFSFEATVSANGTERRATRGRRSA